MTWVGSPHHEQGTPGKRSLITNPGRAQAGQRLRNARTRSTVARFMARIRLGLRYARMSVSRNAAPQRSMTSPTDRSSSTRALMVLKSPCSGEGFPSTHPMTITPLVRKADPFGKRKRRGQIRCDDVGEVGAEIGEMPPDLEPRFAIGEQDELTAERDKSQKGSEAPLARDGDRHVGVLLEGGGDLGPRRV